SAGSDRTPARRARHLAHRRRLTPRAGRRPGRGTRLRARDPPPFLVPWRIGCSGLAAIGGRARRRLPRRPGRSAHMTLVMGRGPGRFGGIYRRSRELSQYCARHGHQAVGLVLLANSDEPEDTPVRTLSYSRAHIHPAIVRAQSAEEVLAACEVPIERL